MLITLSSNDLTLKILFFLKKHHEKLFVPTVPEIFYSIIGLSDTEGYHCNTEVN